MNLTLLTSNERVNCIHHSINLFIMKTQRYTDDPDTDTEPTSLTRKDITRGNFSRFGKSCDQKFYKDGLNQSKPKKKVTVKEKKQYSKSTYGFSCVGRQKRGNYRFPNKKCGGQLIYEPKYFQGQQKNPSWSFSKTQRYNNAQIVEYEACKKHPFVKNDQNVIFAQSSSAKDLKGSVRMSKNASVQSTAAELMKTEKNYSILGKRAISAIGYFHKSKISKSYYLEKQRLMSQEEENQKSIERNQSDKKTYSNFFKSRSRHSNQNMKGFETFMQSYNDEKQFDNFFLTVHPTKPQRHIDFKKQTARKTKIKQPTKGNLSPPSIDFSRFNDKKVHLQFDKFKHQIKTRYDRVGLEPNTLIDIDPTETELGGMVTMDKMTGRNQQLFPIVDPVIKKGGDEEMKQSLKMSISIKQINEALRPKCSEKIKI